MDYVLTLLVSFLNVALAKYHKYLTPDEEKSFNILIFAIPTLPDRLKHPDPPPAPAPIQPAVPETPPPGYPPDSPEVQP